MKNTLPLSCLLVALLTLAACPDTQPRPRATHAYPEPHGTTVCASGCSLSRHPTPPLTQAHFQELVKAYAGQPMSEESPALEELLYFGPQTLRWLDCEETPLDAARLGLLRSELRHRRVKVEFRLLDDQGVARVWMPPQTVPLDIRQVFEPLQTVDFQPPEASGTVKRVGLHHIWQRI